MTNPEQNQGAFARLLADADELLRLPVRAAKVFGTHAAAQFGGLAELLDAVLPTEREAEERLARAIQMLPSTLRALRAGRLDPLEVAPRALATLGRAIDLDETTFTTLLMADHEAMSRSAASALARGADVDAGAALADARAAWRDLELDDPSLLEDDLMQ